MGATSPNVLFLAGKIVENGKPYLEYVGRESNESGPYSLEYVGIRWGQLKIEMSPDGHVFMTKRGEEYGGTLWCVTVYQYGIKERATPERRAIKETLEFERTRLRNQPQSLAENRVKNLLETR